MPFSIVRLQQESLAFEEAEAHADHLQSYSNEVQGVSEVDLPMHSVGRRISSGNRSDGIDVDRISEHTVLGGACLVIVVNQYHANGTNS